ncbi:hypothetical protein B7P43_G03272 [Cryptotermes secundus]|uniref:BRCT domain-containing protein n=1 Tax=Cryptotermes secundus TaxID=105785 RepID=A0A2J7PIC6_9NEOP|nr:hypothetical protein B7P43_G03272 [Cryptotermes secundus]
MDLCDTKLRTGVSDIKNNSGNNCSDTQNNVTSKRISDSDPERSNLAGEEPIKKKRKSSNIIDPCISDTQKSSTITIVRKSRPFRNSAAKDINKRNAKGETRLHVACIKHEAVHHGFVEIAELLLKYGAMVNVPGYNNITPLHEAVLNNKLGAVKLLLMYGADVEARDVNGMTPRNNCKTEEMETVLNSGVSVSVIKPLTETKAQNLDLGQIILFGCRLNKEQHKQLMTLTQQLKIKMKQSYSSVVTHILVPTDANNACSIDTDVMQGILQGKWIVSCNWLSSCLEMGKVIHPEEFEVRGTSHFPNSDAPKRGRMNAEKQLPGLFNGCHIYLAGVGATYTFDNSRLTKTDVVTLIRSGNGLVLSREPDPESIPSGERTVPYHAAHNGSLAKCSHYVIYRSGRNEPKLKYNMAHIKSLSVQWLFDCMESFSLREPV